MNITKKLTLMRVLKVIFYLLGFPLLLLFVAKDSMVFFDEKVFSETAMNGIWFVVGIWAAVTLVQIGLSLTVKNSQIRTIITIVVAFALLLIPMQIFDATTSKKIDNIRTENENYNVTVEKYEKQTQWFNTLSKDEDSKTDDLIGTVDLFVDTYGLDGYYPKVYRTITQLNTLAVDKDGNIVDSKKVEKIIADSGYIYNPNGLLYDGYVFGINNAIDLLINYHEYQATEFKDETDNIINADEALAAAIVRAEASQEWIDYSTSDEFIANEEAAKAMYITEPRLNAILDALLKGLGSNEGIQAILGVAGGFIPAEYASLVDLLNEEGPEVTIDIIAEAAYNILGSLTHQQDALRADLNATSTIEEWAAYDAAVLKSQELVTTLNGFGLTDLSSANAIKAGVMNFLGELSFYQHPENKMSWDFMTAEDKALGLDEYAWVKYHCEKFGRVGGCVLISTEAPIVGGTIGTDTDASQAFTLDQLYQLRTDLSYQPETYPLFAARRYVNMWYGIIAISIFLTALFAKKEDEINNQIISGGIA